MNHEQVTTVSAPANILLLGEYAVLEEGGLGLAVALDVRARGEHRSAAPGPVEGSSEAGGATGTAALGVRGRIPGGEVVWPGDTGVLGRVTESLRDRFGPISGDITVDTCEFFHEDGRKRGYGSSAALTATLVALWLAAVRGDNRLDVRDIVQPAVDAHRAAQNGRGSGYDVATSVLGGIVLFTGGSTPRAERVELPWKADLALFPGRRDVNTRDAVARYETWKRDDPSGASAYLARSNDLVRRFVVSRSWGDAAEVVRRYRSLAMQLGDSIGIPAGIDAPGELAHRDGVVWKAVGAGDELGVAIADRSIAPGEGFARLTVAERGISWE